MHDVDCNLSFAAWTLGSCPQELWATLAQAGAELKLDWRQPAMPAVSAHLLATPCRPTRSHIHEMLHATKAQQGQR